MLDRMAVKEFNRLVNPPVVLSDQCDLCLETIDRRFMSMEESVACVSRHRECAEIERRRLKRLCRCPYKRGAR